MSITVITPTIRPAGLEITQYSLKNQTMKHDWQVEIGYGVKHDLNQAFNNLIRRSKGELIVVLQDYIRVGPLGLQKFWEAYQKYPDTFFTGPVGKTNSPDFTGDVKWDWRKEGAEEVDWQHCEFDWAAFPRDAICKIGGFDEELDNFWSCDNVNVCFRADQAGYRFRNINDNTAIAYDHDAFIPHPFRKNFNAAFHNARLDEFRAGLKLDYLN